MGQSLDDAPSGDASTAATGTAAGVTGETPTAPVTTKAVGGDRQGETASPRGQSPLGKDGASEAAEGVAPDVSYTDRRAMPPTILTMPTPDAVTIGEALEAAAVGAGDIRLDENNARAIKSAEALASGSSVPPADGIGASAQTGAQFNRKPHLGRDVTLADVLTDATGDLHADKMVTYEDAIAVIEAELQGRSGEDLQPGGVAASLVAAANLNEQAGLTPPARFDDEETVKS